MLTLIAMIIIAYNSPFYSQSVTCNFRQLMTCHWVYLLTYILILVVLQLYRMVSVSG